MYSKSILQYALRSIVICRPLLSRNQCSYNFSLLNFKFHSFTFILYLLLLILIMHSCPPMPPAPCPPDCPPSKPKSDTPQKYYREIGTAVIGNHLIIRMEREKGKTKKLKGWDPPCDCDMVEIQRPTNKEGPKILKGWNNNRILFRVESPGDEQNKNVDSHPQSIFYEVGQCRGGQNTNDQCRTITFAPLTDGPGYQEVHTDRLRDGNDNIFLLKVKKKPDDPEEPRRHIELELTTPNEPPPPELPKIPPKKVLIVDEKEPLSNVKSTKRGKTKL